MQKLMNCDHFCYCQLKHIMFKQIVTTLISSSWVQGNKQIYSKLHHQGMPWNKSLIIICYNLKMHNWFIRNKLSFCRKCSIFLRKAKLRRLRKYICINNYIVLYIECLSWRKRETCSWSLIFRRIIWGPHVSPHKPSTNRTFPYIHFH